MRIYIDEAGGFVVPPRVRPYAYSLVFSLAVPSVVETELLYEFIRLRDGWPRPAVEIKGSQLDESQAAEVLALVSRYDILASYYAVDMTTHGHDVVNDFKLRQAAEITAQLTSQHHPDLIAQLHRDADAIRALPNQLFLQAVLTIDLVLENLRVIPLYYAQRLPNELGNIEWIIDPKDVQRTEMEELWTEFVLPFGEDKFSKKSLKLLPDADYSYFEAAYGVKPDDTEMTAHLRWMHKVHGTPLPGSGRGALDAGRLLSQRQFVDSRDSLGVQLADTLGSILRRAYNDRLGYDGWKDFGRLLARKSPEQSSIIQIGSPKNASPMVEGRAKNVWKALEIKSKPMILG